MHPGFSLYLDLAREAAALVALSVWACAQITEKRRGKLRILVRRLLGGTAKQQTLAQRP